MNGNIGTISNSLTIIGNVNLPTTTNFNGSSLQTALNSKAPLLNPSFSGTVSFENLNINNVSLNTLISNSVGIGLKRTIAKAFPVINFDEYRTSCLDWRTEKYNNNAKVMDKHGKTKKLHSVLVSTIPNNDNTKCKTSFQNRDRNSVLNIKKLTKWYLEKGERIYNYRRDIKLPERNLEEKTATASAMKPSKRCTT